MKLGLRLIVFVLAMAFPVLAAPEPVVVQKEGLENRVEFWKKVYTQYGKDDIIIHDEFHVNLIYDVASESDVNSKIRTVRATLDEIRLNLKTPEYLSPAAKQTADKIIANGVSLSPSALGELRTGIHTQRGIKERFRDGVIRSGRYIESFRNILESHGVPAEIALLPLVESSFENRSLSKAGAAGIWQFTRGTGRMYMRVTSKLDERLDPPKATRAAARLLMDNYNALGSWPLAITAYNHGRAGMVRASTRVGPEITTIINKYDGPRFGYASMNFYAEFVAAIEVYENYQQYFGQLVLDTPSSPAFRTARAPAVTSVASDKYRVRKGDTLWDIAVRFELSIAELMAKNNLKKSVIHAGQILLVK